MFLACAMASRITNMAFGAAALLLGWLLYLLLAFGVFLVTRSRVPHLHMVPGSTFYAFGAFVEETTVHHRHGILRIHVQLFLSNIYMVISTISSMYSTHDQNVTIYLKLVTRTTLNHRSGE